MGKNNLRSRDWKQLKRSELEPNQTLSRVAQNTTYDPSVIQVGPLLPLEYYLNNLPAQMGGLRGPPCTQMEAKSLQEAMAANSALRKKKKLRRRNKKNLRRPSFC